ncbi:MAG TPA: MipA/OmpV family protein [Telluria sp.]|nr:MipA/OmpV family protein [Telluria sp.]
MKILLSICALSAATSAAAQEAQPLWEAGVAAFGVSTPAYPGSSDRSSRVLPLPFLIYRGEVLRADQGGVGARLFRSERVEFDVGFSGALPANSDDVDARRGMPDLNTLVEFGPRVKILLARPTPTSRVRLELPLRAVMEIEGGVRRQGTTFEPKLSYEMLGADPRWGFDFSAAAVFGDKRISRYFYEVAPQYAIAGRPAYQADAGLLLTRLGVSASYKFNQDVRLFGFVREESYRGAANADSPLMKKSSGASVGLGFTWTLGRSATLAKSAQ